MIYSKEQLIKEFGLEGMEPDRQLMLVNAFYANFNLQIGMMLANKLTDAQMDELQKVIQTDDAKAIDWIRTTIQE